MNPRRAMKIKAAMLAAAALLHLSPGIAATVGVQQAAISTQGSGPYYRLNLPVGIYPGSVHPDLHDVRVRNAAGELLSFSWVDTETETAELHSTKVPLFPLPDEQSLTVNTANSFRKNPDGSLTQLSEWKTGKKKTVPVWILDVSQSKGQLLQVRLELAAQVNGLFGFSLEASDDLKSWRLISADEQVIQLQHQNATVQKLEINLYHATARYLRLRWRDADQAPELLAVTVDSQQQSYTPPPLQWSALIQPKGCSNTYCDYPLPEKTPIDSLRLQLSEPNTLATVSVWGQLPPAQATSSYRHHHNPLYPLHVLRHHKQVTAQQTDREVWLNETLAYRLSLPNGEAKSPDLLMDGASYKGLRLQTTGPLSSLGKPPPGLQIASLPRSLVFLARGKGPYILEWGVEAKDGAALPLHTLMPNLKIAQLIKADDASVEIASQPVIGETEKFATAPVTAPAKEHKPWLWAALAAGLVILGAMVWSLLKSMSIQKEDTKKDTTEAK
ncbi:DUF3999 domain-containing protein [Undibacterium sp. Ji50W]|uniref:DUF3999 domain-containing protein n=1 Tax=Undibacterium sp. Ji50W TaxID=3413041 RepID=UPI003BF0B33F